MRPTQVLARRKKGGDREEEEEDFLVSFSGKILVQEEETLLSVGRTVSYNMWLPASECEHICAPLLLERAIPLVPTTTEGTTLSPLQQTVASVSRSGEGVGFVLPCNVFFHQFDDFIFFAFRVLPAKSIQEDPAPAPPPPQK